MRMIATKLDIRYSAPENEDASKPCHKYVFRFVRPRISHKISRQKYYI
jgi:hypothetical protein